MAVFTQDYSYEVVVRQWLGLTITETHHSLMSILGGLKQLGIGKAGVTRHHSLNSVSPMVILCGGHRIGESLTWEQKFPEGCPRRYRQRLQ